MRMSGQVRQVVHLRTGKVVWTKYPITREESIQEDVVKYYPMEPCPIHGGDPVVYTKTNIRGCCAQNDAVAAYNEAIRRGEPKSVQEARTMDLDFYWSPIENKKCGHVGKMRLDGKCFICSLPKAKTPRQIALEAGETWYMPVLGSECTACGVLARRRVVNGSCEECERRARVARESVRAREEAERPKEFHELYPDQLMDRHVARGLGFKAFRTGKPCRNGHTGWRYVSTGNCIDCIKGAKDETVVE